MRRRARLHFLLVLIAAPIFGGGTPMVGHSGPTPARIFDNSIIDKLVQEGFTDKLYNK